MLHEILLFWLAKPGIGLGIGTTVSVRVSVCGALEGALSSNYRCDTLDPNAFRTGGGCVLTECGPLAQIDNPVQWPSGEFLLKTIRRLNTHTDNTNIMMTGDPKEDTANGEVTLSNCWQTSVQWALLTKFGYGGDGIPTQSEPIVALHPIQLLRRTVDLVSCTLPGNKWLAFKAAGALLQMRLPPALTVQLLLPVRAILLP
jgi:hypothetical protein